MITQLIGHSSKLTKEQSHENEESLACHFAVWKVLLYPLRRVLEQQQILLCAPGSP